MTNSQKEKKAEYDRKWYQKNKEKISEYNQLNKEKRAEYNRKWEVKNKEKRREQKRKYREENKENRLEYAKAHRDKRRAYCREYLGGKCVVCGTTHNLQFDHIKREEKKYNITEKLTIKFDNLKEELDKCQLLCVDCHLEKTAKECADITHNTVPLSKLNTMP